MSKVHPEKKEKMFECLHTLEGHSKEISSVAISTDGVFVVTGSWDNTCKIWDRVTGECLHTLEGHSDNVNSVAISADGALVVTGSFDMTCKVWDRDTCKCLHTLEGHSAEVSSVATSADGAFVVTGSTDKTCKVWDRVTGKCLHTLEGHYSRVLTVAISADGAFVVTGSWDQTCKVWDSSMWHDGRISKGDNRSRESFSRPLSDENTSLIEWKDDKFSSRSYKTKVVGQTIPDLMAETMTLMCRYTASNPRRLKRTVNVLQLINQLSMIRPVSELDSKNFLSREKDWELFSIKIVKWVFLCENYPFRTSFLVHILCDIEQKHRFNSMQPKTGELDLKFQCDETLYKKVLNYSLSEFYHAFVEKYIYIVESSAKMNRLDGDPEEFALLLATPMSQLPKFAEKIVCCGDILGVAVNADSMKSDRNFALLTYSFNLNVSMRRQISIEMTALVSCSEMTMKHREIAEHDREGRVDVLERGTIVQKRELLWRRQMSKGTDPPSTPEGETCKRKKNENHECIDY